MDPSGCTQTLGTRQPVARRTLPAARRPAAHAAPAGLVALWGTTTTRYTLPLSQPWGTDAVTLAPPSLTSAVVGALGVGAVGVWRAAALRRATLIDVWSSSTENKEVNNVTYTLIYLLLCSVAGYKWTG